MLTSIKYALAATVMTASAAFAVSVEPGSAFSLGGEFRYTVPLRAGDVFQITSVDDEIEARRGSFSGLTDGTATLMDPTLRIADGTANDGFAFSIGAPTGVFTFTLAGTDAAALFDLGTLKIVNLSGTILAKNGGLDQAPLDYVFSATAPARGGEGTWSLSVVHALTAVPLPAALPMLLVALGAFGALAGPARRAV